MSLRMAACALVLALVSGCSTLKLAYNQADHIAAWMADDYFDLDADQKEAFRDRFQQFHAWHRATQLGQYAEFLEAVQARLRVGVNTTDANWAYDAVKAEVRTLALNGYAGAASLLATLSDRQLASARRKFERSNRKFAGEIGLGAAPDEQRRLRAKRQLERIEHWTGSLSTAQEDQIEKMSRALPLLTELRYRDRIRRQNEFLMLLAERGRRDTFALKLRDWLLDWDRTRSAVDDQALAQYVDASAAMYINVHALLNAEQRRHVAAQVQRYIDTFHELARETTKAAFDDSHG
jgi:hypothetical protein